MHPDKCCCRHCCQGPMAGTDLIPASAPGTWADFLKIFVPRHCWGKLLCTEKGRAVQVVIKPGSAWCSHDRNFCPWAHPGMSGALVEWALLLEGWRLVNNVPFRRWLITTFLCLKTWSSVRVAQAEGGHWPLDWMTHLTEKWHFAPTPGKPRPRKFSQEFQQLNTTCALVCRHTPVLSK